MSWYISRPRRAGRVFRVGDRQRLKPGVFWEPHKPEVGSTFVHREAEYVVESVERDPASGWIVNATPSAVFRTDEEGERCE